MVGELKNEQTQLKTENRTYYLYLDPDPKANASFLEFEIEAGNREEFRKKLEKIVEEIKKKYKDEDFLLIDLFTYENGEEVATGMERFFDEEVQYELVEDFMDLYDDLQWCLAHRKLDSPKNQKQGI